MATKITISSVIHAPLAKVWEFYTNPKHITQWNFAMDSWQCPFASNDLKIGGKYKARMEAKDGSFGFDFEATYNQIIHQNELTYTMPDGRQVTTHFLANGDQTSVKTVFDAEEENPIEMQQEGWQAILDNFKKYVERS